MFYVLNMLAAMHARIDSVTEARKDRGATATEYAILVAFIAIAVIVGVTLFGNALSGWFSDLANTVSHWAN